MRSPKISKRKHATMACVSCRESKVKCNGGQPSCSTCINRDRECSYRTIDKRKLPLRVAIELLTLKVNQLRQFICDNGLEPPRLPLEKETALKKILENFGLNEAGPIPLQTGDGDRERPLNTPRDLPCLPSVTYIDTPTTRDLFGVSDSLAERDSETNLHTKLSPLTQPTQNEHLGIPLSKTTQNIAQGTPSSILNTWDLDLGFGTCITTPPLDDQSLFESSPNNMPSVEQEELLALLQPLIDDDERMLVEESENPTEIEDLINEISDRVGTLRIGPSGKTQFCGPTSPFNLTGIVDPEGPEESPLKRDLPLEYHDRFGSEPEISPAMEEHLINLYFCWQDPSFHVVDRKIYEEAKAKWQDMEETPFYSHALRYAMCALGSAFESRFHPNLVTFPNTLVDLLGARAKSLLELELDYPCVATVQALVILSNHEIGNGKEARGWLFSGMAMRLAFDLALHLDMSHYVSRGEITSADAEIRRTVFWGAYTVDHHLGFHLGRPSRTSMEDVTVGKPHGQPSQLSHYRWAPYENQTRGNETSELLDCTEAVSQQLVSLCELMVPCGYILYGTSRISKSVLQELNAKIVAELCGWKARLPPFLQINLDDRTSPYLPHTLLLHMQYHQNIIYAHRPWMSKNGLQPQPPKGPGYLHAREMCIGSAIAISKILILYETRYTLRRINVKAVSITSSAILLLLFAAVTKYPGHPPDEITMYLSSCFRALDEFALSWQSARRAKELLFNLRRQWEIRTRLRKDRRNLEEAAFLPRKRLRGLRGVYQVPHLRHGQYTPGRCEPDIGFHIDSEFGWMVMNDGDSGKETLGLDRDSTFCGSQPG